MRRLVCRVVRGAGSGIPEPAPRLSTMMCPMYARIHFRDRGALITGLMAGTLDAADAVASTRPAVELLGLLVPIDGLTEEYLSRRDCKGLDITRGEFEPWRRQLLAVVAALLERWVGRDADAWLALVMRAGSHRGSVVELVDSVVRPERADPSSWAGRAPRWPRGVDASAVLLSMAPPEIVEGFLGTCLTSGAERGVLTRMLARGPLHPLFVDYATGLGTDAMRNAVRRNPVHEITQLREKVLRAPTDVAVLEHAYLRASEADRALRIACVRLAEAAGGFRPRFLERLSQDRDGDVDLLEPLLASGDPELVLSTLRRVTTKVRPLRWAAYATIARMAGPEPVWALEQERAGTLARMDGPVRASMAVGSEAPILAAAEAAPVNVGPAGSLMELGAPLIEPWPYTELIRECVDGVAYRRAAVDNLAVDRPSSIAARA